MINLYEKIWKKISEQERIVIFTHVHPDGDTIGTSIALKELIKIKYPKIDVKISGDKYPSNLLWMKGNDNVSNEFIKHSLAILVDTSSITRTFDKRILNAKEIIKIDHHHPEGNQWSLAIEGDTVPATGQIIWDMIIKLELKYNEIVKEALWVSIWTDTSGLSERNPSKETFKAMEWVESDGINRKNMLGKIDLSPIQKKEILNLVKNPKKDGNVLYVINDFFVSNDLYRPATELFYKKYESEIYIFVCKLNEKLYRVGFRSKEYDVSKVASYFGGGGHLTSSGTIINNLEKLPKIIEYINDKMKIKV
ncbi:MAG: DHH family phosphoesterase [Mycoplasmatales bacterium]|nr:DHH family phosphoesterase [Mycoplasmatales bacterium]